MARVVLTVVALATLAAVGGSARADSTTPFLVGFSEDLPKEIGEAAVAPAAALGGAAFRLTTQWTPGAKLEPAERAKLQRAVDAAGTGQRVVLAVYGDAGTDAPRTAAARTEYCGFVEDVLAAFPSIRHVVIWNEPNKSLFWSPQAGAPAAYAELLATCYDALPLDVNVLGLALSSTGNDNAGSTSPGAFIRGVGAAYRDSGRESPLLDTVAHHPYGLTAAERPWRRHIQSTTIGLGDWNKLMANLATAFAGTGQPLPGEGGVTIWYTEAGSQTSVGAQPGYDGDENVATVPDFIGGEPDTPPPPETSAAPDQATQVRDAVRLAACQPHVAAYFNFLLADEPRLEGWQSGALWVDRTPKGSHEAFRAAFAEAAAGAVDCDALKGGRPSADYTAPSVPTGVTATTRTGPLQVDVSWSAATDDASTVSYRVYRNGAHVGTTADTSWTNVTVAPETTYRYTVRALDAAGNLGGESAAATLTTPADAPPPPEPPAPGGGAAVPPDVSVALVTTPSAPVAGASVDVLATVATAAAGGAATGLSLRVELPAGARLLGPPAFERGSGCVGDTTVVCDLDFLGSGASTPVRFSLVAPNGGRVTATALLAGTDSNPANNVASFDVAAPRAPSAGPPPPRVNHPPTKPRGLTARVQGRRLVLSWRGSRDDRGVRAYVVHRDGKLRRRVRVRTIREPLLRGRHVYVVRAVDAGGLRSAPARVVVRRR